MEMVLKIACYPQKMWVWKTLGYLRNSGSQKSIVSMAHYAMLLLGYSSEIFISLCQSWLADDRNKHVIQNQPPLSSLHK